MDWALKRRIIAIFAVILVVTVFILIPYTLTHQEVPSCADKKQNQGEEGIDCGGPCALVCKTSVQDLHTLWTKVFPVRSGVYDLVAYIENPNFYAAATKLEYVAQLFDDAGDVIAEKSGESYALPGERFAIFVDNMNTGAKIATKGLLSITPGFAWTKAASAKKIFSVENKTLESPDKKPRLSALLSNETADVYRNVDVLAIIYDKTGQPVAVSKTIVEKSVGGSKEPIFFTWTGPLNYAAESGKCETPIDAILAIDRSGSMRSDGRTPPQPLTDALNAAAQFVGHLTKNDQAGYISFATAASNPIDQSLTNQFSRMTQVISNTTIHTDGTQYTNIGEALRRAIDEFATQRHNPDARQVIVFLTDGAPTFPKDPKGKDKKFPEEYALAVAAEAKQNNITIYTIGLGTDANGEYLTKLASAPENYYPAASGAELADIYAQIGTAMCKKAPSVIEIIPRVNWMIPQ